MRGNTLASSEFIITNKGNEDLIIRKVKGTCTCLTSTVSRNIIKKGETAKVKVNYNTRDRSGSESKSVMVYSNDPSNPLQVLTVQANVIR